MTLSEFKAWFEGFTEHIDLKNGLTGAQLARMMERVAEIDDKPTTETIYIDRYVRPYRHWLDKVWLDDPETRPWTARLDGSDRRMADPVRHEWDAKRNLVSFDRMPAMRDAGRAEELSLRAS